MKKVTMRSIVDFKKSHKKADAIRFLKVARKRATRKLIKMDTRNSVHDLLA